jgi:FMN phosphatase YigB (HAD superfamily)
MNPKAIFLDWNKTLSNSRFWEQLENPEHKYNSYHQKIINSLFVENKDLINPWMQGKSTAEEMCKMISEQTGIEEKIIFNELVESARNMQFVSIEIPKLIKKIKSKGIKVIIATDNMDTFQFTIEKMKLRDLFDDILNSFDLKAQKGDFENSKSLFFETFLKENNLEYSETILLDDSVSNSDPLNNLGMRTIRILNGEHLIEELGKILI